MAELMFGGVLVGSEDPERLVAFYRGVLGEPTMQQDGATGWAFGDAWFVVMEHDRVKGGAAEPQRVIVNFGTPDVPAEFERISSAGATVIQEPYEFGGMRIATFADPDGNYFQLMTPLEDAPAS